MPLHVRLTRGRQDCLGGQRREKTLPARPRYVLYAYFPFTGISTPSKSRFERVLCGSTILFDYPRDFFRVQRTRTDQPGMPQASPLPGLPDDSWDCDPHPEPGLDPRPFLHAVQGLLEPNGVALIETQLAKLG